MFWPEARRPAVAGRTDTGVHASGQVVSVDVSGGPELARVPAALNAHLPPDVAVLGCTLAPEGFHARFSARSRLLRVPRAALARPLAAARGAHLALAARRSRPSVLDVVLRGAPAASTTSAPSRPPRPSTRSSVARCCRRRGSSAATSSCSASRPTPSCVTWCARSSARCSRPRPASAAAEDVRAAARGRAARVGRRHGPAARPLPRRRALRRRDGGEQHKMNVSRSTIQGAGRRWPGDSPQCRRRKGEHP